MSGSLSKADIRTSALGLSKHLWNADKMFRFGAGLCFIARANKAWARFLTFPCGDTNRSVKLSVIVSSTEGLRDER